MRRVPALALACCMGFFVLQAQALELNQATVAELDSLKGMGPALSAKVLQARQDRAFDNWGDFMRRVPGVGVAKAQAFSAQGLTVQGQGLVSGR